MDGSLYRWFNRLADRTSWAHGVMKFYASNGIVVFGVLILVVYVVAWRRDDHRGVVLGPLPRDPGRPLMLAAFFWDGALLVRQWRELRASREG